RLISPLSAQAQKPSRPSGAGKKETADRTRECEGGGRCGRPGNRARNRARQHPKSLVRSPETSHRTVKAAVTAPLRPPVYGIRPLPTRAPARRAGWADPPLAPQGPLLQELRPPFSLSSALRTFIMARRAAPSTLGNARSSFSMVSMMARATISRANHLLSAGITYHGACGVEVARIMSSYAFM